MKTLQREWAVLAALLLLAVTLVYAWTTAPERVPVHWGLAGTPDRYSGKLEAFGLLPSIMLGVMSLLYFIQRGRGQANAPLLRVARIGVLLLATLMTLASEQGWSSPRPVLVVVGLFLTLLGNVTGKAQPSAWVGVRTPWTYLSRHAWYASQRRGGVCSPSTARC